jgi:hypothetical protein
MDWDAVLRSYSASDSSRRFDMIQHGTVHVHRRFALAIASAPVAAVALLAPTHGGAQERWLSRATSACEEAGGTLTTPGSGVIFECAFPPSINVVDILGTPLLLRTLPNICFHQAHGSHFGPDVLANAVDCFE